MYDAGPTLKQFWFNTLFTGATVAHSHTQSINDQQQDTPLYARIYTVSSRFNSYSAGTDFSRQNLMCVDIRFCLLKSLPVPHVRVTILRMDHNIIGIQMNQTFITISKCKKPFGLYGFDKENSAL